MVKGFIFTVAGMLLSLAAMSQREITNLNGKWEIEESIKAEKAPSEIQPPGPGSRTCEYCNPGL